MERRGAKGGRVKVIGTGAPRMLTVRLNSCEVSVLRDELHHQRAVITEAAAQAHAKSALPGAGASDRDIEDHHDELLLISRLLDDLLAPVARDRPRELVAPTWVLAPVIRGAAVEAVERLRDVVAAFASDTGARTADEVRAAVHTAAALAATLIGVDHAEHHAVDS
jgi:hypothetical protein